MLKVSLVTAMLVLLTLSSCANTAKGMVKDATATGQALDASGHTVLKAGARGNKAAQ